MNGHDLRVIDSTFTAIKAAFEMKEAENIRLRAEVADLWGQVGDLTKQTLELVKQNRDLADQLISGGGNAHVH